MSFALYSVLESKLHGSLERAARMANKVVSAQAGRLKDNVKTYAKAVTLSSIHDKLNSAQGEALPPKHEGERTG